MDKFIIKKDSTSEETTIDSFTTSPPQLQSPVFQLIEKN